LPRETVSFASRPGNIFRYTQDDASPWVQVPGGLSDIGAGADGTVWGVNSAQNIFVYTQDDATPWIQIPGGLSDIGAGVDGTVWGVNSAGNIYRYIRS
jgi:virginiamycin B lyase